jgi:hypothetical protein
MDVEMAAGFAVVIVCLLAILILVFAGRGIIEKTYRKTSHTQPKAGRGSEENRNRGDAR